jgi:hypothetical protein
MIKAVFKGILIVFGLVLLVPLVRLLVAELGPLMGQVGHFVVAYHSQLLIAALAALFIYLILYIINN